MAILSDPIPDIIQFFPIFLTIYSISYLYIFRHWKPQKSRSEASSCMISLTHSTPTLIMAPLSILSSQNPTFSSPNTHFMNRVLDYSISYFIMDLIHYLVFSPDEVLFVLHHVATLFVFVTCRYVVGCGGYGIIVLLILAEVTSLLQNVWTLARARKDDGGGGGGIARRVYEAVELPFYGVYSVVRGVLGPWFVVKMGWFYVSGKANGVIPRWVWVSWMVVVVAAIMVSVLWVWDLWIEWFRERRRKRDSKVR